MKTKAIFACALLAGIFAACNNKENAPEAIGFEKGQKVTLEAEIAGQDKDAKKIKGQLQGNKLNFIWEEEDVINVIVGEDTREFVLISGAGTGSARFTGEMPAAGTEYTVEVPCAELANQTYLAEGLASKLMAFKTPTPGTTHRFTLAPQNAIFKLELASNDSKKVKEIILTNKAEDGATYTLTCTEAVELTTTPTCFMLAVAPGIWESGFSVKVLGEGGTELLPERIFPESVTFEAGKSCDLYNLTNGMYEDEDGHYHIANLGGLKYFRDQVNGGNTFAGKTVLLDADIDMAGEAWTPIGNVTSYPGISFYGTFDGQDNTIKNLTCTDVTLNYACAGLFGSLMGTIQNLKMTNVNINSNHYAAAIAAYSSSSESKINNCSVIGGTITSTSELVGTEYDNGDKAGAIMGLNAEGGTVDGCYVEGVTITAYRDLGAIVGAGAVNKTTNNTAKNCTLVIDRTNFYGDKDVNANPIVGRNTGGTLNANNTFENVTVATTANTADALRAAVKAVNAATSGIPHTITIANGTYEVSDMIIRQNVKFKSLTIKAATNKGVTIKPNSDSKTKMIFLIDGCAGYNNPEYVKFDGIKFDMSGLETTVTSHPIFCSSSDTKDQTLRSIDGYIASWYAHNVIVVNCELKGSGVTESNSLLYAPNGAGINHVTVENCVVENAGYCVNGYFTDVKIIDTEISDCKACANINTKGISVSGCTISTWHDYCIRTNGGPVAVENNTFNMTWTGDATDAAIVFLRGTPAQDNNNFTATTSGNTSTKAGAEMHDIYCGTAAWTVNNEARAAGSGFSF